jgi:hypothetical protein
MYMYVHVGAPECLAVFCPLTFLTTGTDETSIDRDLFKSNQIEAYFTVCCVADQEPRQIVFLFVLFLFWTK